MTIDFNMFATLMKHMIDN